MVAAAVTVAAIDIGTNSVRLLITGPGGDHRSSKVCGLGRGLATTGRLDPAGVAAAFEVLGAYRVRMEEAGVGAARAVATAAAREAADSAEFLERAREVLGFAPEIISGHEEAVLSYEGATAALEDDGWTVVDIGGGSTEVIDASAGRSFEMGSVRVTDRHFPRLPPRLGAVEAAVSECMAVFDGLAPSERVAGVAGTWTTLRDMTLAASTDRPDTRLTTEEIEVWVARLGVMRLDDIAALAGLDPARAPVILGGAVVALAVLRRLGADTATVTDHDLLDGIAHRLSAGGVSP